MASRMIPVDCIPGKRFSRWVIVNIAESVNGYVHVLCECDCGTRKIIDARSVVRGNSRSCGCLRKEVTVARSTIHGLAPRHGRCAEYNVWLNIRRRCLDPSTSNFKNYGGRGIKVCDRWLSFENFCADMGPRPSPAHSIDRKENDGDYCPENCRWATRSKQMNNMRTNRRISSGGITQTLAEWSRATGINRRTLAQRIDNGWTAEEAVSTPV